MNRFSNICQKLFDVMNTIEAYEKDINVIHPSIPSEKISRMLYCTFFSQLVALFEAKKKRKKDCHFVTAKNIRNVSNQMIY